MCICLVNQQFPLEICITWLRLTEHSQGCTLQHCLKQKYKNNLNVLSWRVIKLWYIHTMEYFLTIKNNRENYQLMWEYF